MSNYTITTYTKAIKIRDTQRKNKKLKAIEKKKIALEEKSKIEKGDENKQTTILTDNPAVASPTNEEENPVKQPSARSKNKKGIDKPING